MVYVVTFKNGRTIEVVDSITALWIAAILSAIPYILKFLVSDLGIPLVDESINGTTETLSCRYICRISCPSR